MHRHCVLVVEDDADARDALVAVLEAQGYCVMPAADGVEGLETLQGTAPCCAIVLDLLMPRMDGWAFRSAQLRDPLLADVPLILLSGHVNLPAIATMLGVRHFISKPVDVDSLVSWLDRHCGRAH